MAQEIADGIDVYRDEVMVHRSSLRRSTLDNFSFMLGHLRGEPQTDLSAPKRTGRERAEQGVPLPEVLRAFRFGFEFLWTRVLAEAREMDEASLDILLETATAIWSLADEYSQALTGAYRDVVSQQLVERDRTRSALVDGLVSGSFSSRATAWEAGQSLHLPFEGRFLVVVAETAASGATGLPGLQTALDELDVQSAWRAQPAYEIVLVSVARTDADAAVNAIRAAASARVGVSPIFERLDDAARAFRFAHVAMESLPAGKRAVTQLEDTTLGELVMANTETTRRVINRVLGSTLSLPDDERDVLLSTAEAWLEAGGSAAEAGRLLYCHQNTVRYRLRRLQEHMGRSLDDPRTVAELAAALQGLRVFPQFLSSAPGRSDG